MSNKQLGTKATKKKAATKGSKPSFFRKDDPETLIPYEKMLPLFKELEDRNMYVNSETGIKFGFHADSNVWEVWYESPHRQENDEDEESENELGTLEGRQYTKWMTFTKWYEHDKVGDEILNISKADFLLDVVDGYSDTDSTNADLHTITQESFTPQQLTKEQKIEKQEAKIKEMKESFKMAMKMEELLLNSMKSRE